MAEAFLKINNLDVWYGKVQALKDINMEVVKGELVVVVGSNGAGKSTLMRTIVGLNKVNRGSIEFRGDVLSTKATHGIVRKGICLVPEGRMIFGNQTVKENLVLGAHWCRPGIGRNDIESDLEDCYRRFPILKERSQQLASTLSGGEQQMLAISRGLMGKPKLLLIDEPSLGLAPIIMKELFETIQRLKREGLTVFLVEQMARMALQIADRGHVLEHGSIILEGPGKTLLEDPHIIEFYLGKE
jgi:branched-chain amino acid transport system ATP-binding protein